VIGREAGVMPQKPMSSTSARKRAAPTTASIVVPPDLKKAIAFMREHMERVVTMAELVRRSGVAARTLRRHFNTFVGVSPLAYRRRMRLAAVREELLKAAADVSLTDCHAIWISSFRAILS
jgi:transcriptional regulator GlxA family with amidase domain